MDNATIIPGNKIYFAEELRPYTVKACNSRYAVCTKPFNLKRTVIYTIIDLQRQVRGTEDLIFCKGFETEEMCEQALARITSGESGISRRNSIDLNIVAIAA